MRKTILLILGMFFGLLGKAQNENALIVWSPDGSSVAYLLEEQPKVSFTESDAVLTTSKLNINYPLSEYLKMTFGTYEKKEDAIKNIVTKAIYKINSSSVEISGLSPKENTSIYSTDGKVLLLGAADDNGHICLSTSSLRQGVYIIKSNTINFKITKK